MEEIIKKWKDKLAEDKRENVYYTRELLDEMISEFEQQVKLFSLDLVGVPKGTVCQHPFSKVEKINDKVHYCQVCDKFM